ncbi:MAG: transporter [Sphingomonas bacterium]|uniref:MFS transporter n=1 Tax=Sphingomonas bacterium TaxID=1895847 RepID=UPI00262C4058|nr:MFS transporter [Sphingomonas bacterium]MDB5710115.1 transporter [Sphingomonas bacterium]
MQSHSTAVDTGRERKAGLAQGVVLVSVTWLAVVAAGVLAPVLPQMADHFAGAPMLGLMIGFVATIPALAVALFSVPIGQMSDRIGARRILVIGMSGYGLAGILPLWLDSLPAIVVSRFVVGMFEAAVMTASTTLISLYFTGLQRDRWLAVQVASTNVMGVIVVLVGGLAGEHGWRAPFFAYAIAIVLLLPVVLVTYEPGRAPEAETGRFNAALAPSWVRLVALRCVLTFFVSVTVYTLIVQFGFLLVERGVSAPSTIGLGISFGAGGVALGSIANTAMLALSSRLRLAVSWLLIAVGLGIVALDASFFAMCLGALAAGLGAGCTVSTLLCITVADVPGALKGRATGAWTAAMFLGQFLNPPIFLLLGYLGGSHAGAFLLYAGICAAIAIAVGGRAVMAWRAPGLAR